MLNTYQLNTTTLNNTQLSRIEYREKMIGELSDSNTFMVTLEDN